MCDWKFTSINNNLVYRFLNLLLSFVGVLFDVNLDLYIVNLEGHHFVDVVTVLTALLICRNVLFVICLLLGPVFVASLTQRFRFVSAKRLFCRGLSAWQTRWASRSKSCLLKSNCQLYCQCPVCHGNKNHGWFPSLVYSNPCTALPTWTKTTCKQYPTSVRCSLQKSSNDALSL